METDLARDQSEVATETTDRRGLAVAPWHLLAVVAVAVVVEKASPLLFVKIEIVDEKRLRSMTAWTMNAGWH